MRGGKLSSTKSFVYSDYVEGLGQTSWQPGGGFWLRAPVTSFQGGNKHTYPHTQTGPCDRDKLSSRVWRISAHTHAHAHSSEIWGPFWQPPSWLGTGQSRSDPRKAKWTRERAGAFVFVECHTSSRGKPITGPGRPLKLWEGCVGIASVATSDVNSNIPISDCFLN